MIRQLREVEKRRAAVRGLAAEHRAGITGPIRWQPDEPVEAVAPVVDDLPFLRRQEAREESEAEHRARRRRADAERKSQERLHSKFRDIYGLDEANRMIG